MNTRVLFLFTIALSLLIVPSGYLWGGAEEARRAFSLGRLDELRKPGTADELTDTYLGFLREETAHPSPPGRGYGGIITHEYILSQIVHASKVPREMNHRRLLEAARAAGPGELRDCIQLALGRRGEKSLVPFLIGYLRDRKHYWRLRQSAGCSLKDLRDERAIPVFVEMLDDPTWHVNRGVKCYDLRNGARFALWDFWTAGIELPPDALERMADTVFTERYDPVRDGPAPKD